MKNYKNLEERFRQLHRIEHGITFLQWDHMVMMPKGGAKNRSESIAELTSLHHQILTAEKTQELLEAAGEEALSPTESVSLLEMRRTYKEAACLPSELVRAQTLAGAKCEHDWRGQRQANDWAGFLENFKEVVHLSREEAAARFASAPDQFDTPYDSLLDLYCTGESSSELASVFTTLRATLPSLLKEVMEKQATEDVIDLSGTFPTNSQKKLNLRLMDILGFDFTQGRADESAHPFSTGDRGDQRITSRYRESEFIEALLATAHETGHASYENGLPKKWDGLPVGAARNLCIHESQSLLFEKQVFLSNPFLDFFVQEIHRTLNLPENVSGNSLWQAATRVQPSLIRVEADEVTYPLHIVLRYEIEKKLINGDMEPDSIPEAWDQGMQSLLGISTGGDYKNGCMQDMHWSDGTFGYFPSYTMGAINSAQLADAFRKRNPDWKERFSTGEVGFLRDFLSEQIWQQGSLQSSHEIMKRATGAPTNPAPFLNHLRDRYIEGLY